MSPPRLIGLAFLIGGIILLILGIRETESFGDQFSKFFTGSYSDHAVWMIIGGAACICIGIASTSMSLRGSKTS